MFFLYMAGLEIVQAAEVGVVRTCTLYIHTAYEQLLLYFVFCDSGDVETYNRCPTFDACIAMHHLSPKQSTSSTETWTTLPVT